MKKNYKKLFALSLLFCFSFLSLSCAQDIIEKNFEKGHEFYIDNQFQNAAKHLEIAAKENHPIAQELYADICLRQLDDKPHPYIEAAMWYLLSAKGGNPDTQTYLEGIIPGILENDDHVAQMKAIVHVWIMEKTVASLPRLSPDKINNYLVWKHNRKIDRTSSQKLPYLFERIASAIAFKLTGRGYQIIDDSLFPASESRTTKYAEETTVFYKTLSSSPLACFSYGPVYFSYFQSLDQKVGDDFLQKPSEQPEIPPLYKFLLSSLHKVTQNKKASELTAISHQDYPWLWAGIMFWKEKNPKQSFGFTSLPEEELIKRLTNFSSKIEQKDIDIILSEVEQKGVFSNNSKHEICKQYDDLMHKYFQSSISRDADIVSSTVEDFDNSLKQQTIDCSQKEGLDSLKTPLFMYYCNNLELTNFSDHDKCYYALFEGQRYFMELRSLTIKSKNPQKKRKRYTDRINNLLEEIKRRGITVIKSNEGA